LYAIIWLYNPLPAIILTRGSAESIMTSLVLLMLIFIMNNKLSIAGLLYGLVVHFKLYPIIYLSAFYLALTKSNKVWKAFKPNANKFKFFTFSAIGFV
jgi:phosphatidylinositol glycan class M